MLFGTVGASLLFSQITASDVGYAFLVIIIGVFSRMGGVFLATIKSKLNYKERALVAVSSFSKGTITATLGGMVLSQMKTKGAGFEEYQQYGSQI